MDDLHSNREAIQQLLDQILATEDLSVFKEQLNQYHPAELADLLESLPKDKRQSIWHLIQAQFKGEILTEAHGEVKQQLISFSSKTELISALKSLQLDELVDLEKRLPEKVLHAVVASMDEQHQKRFNELRKYPENSAGGLMDMDALSIRSDISLAVVLRYLRWRSKNNKTLPEHSNSISVTDKQNVYQGELLLSTLVSMPRSTLVVDAMSQKNKPINVKTRAREVQRLFEDHDLISAAVVDKNNHLLGRITIDDVVDYIRKQSEHMLLGPVGLSEKSDLFSSIINSVRSRLFWLGLNLINAFLAALVISFYSASIEKIVALAILMPIVASMSGVIGNQTLTLVTRGIALSQITRKNSRLLLLKEASVGLVNGLIWACFVGVISYLWFASISISIVFAFAMLLSILFASISGTLIPMVLDKLNLDPAIAGSVMIVAISDILGFLIFLSIATTFLI